MKKRLTAKEAANELGLSYGTVLQYIYWGRLQATKVGHNRMIDAAEIERYKAKRRGDQ